MARGLRLTGPMQMIVIDTIGKLHHHGHRTFGWCRRCAALYRPERGPGNPPASFDIDLPALIAERGTGHPVVGMAPVPCPYCGSRQTEIRILGAQPMRDGPALPARATAAPPPAGAC